MKLQISFSTDISLEEKQSMLTNAFRKGRQTFMFSLRMSFVKIFKLLNPVLILFLLENAYMDEEWQVAALLGLVILKHRMGLQHVLPISFFF